MPSPDAISVDLPITTYGGLVTQYDPQTLPVGASPFNQDVAFSGINPSGKGFVAGVATRPGLGTGFYAAPFAGNPSVNYIKTFVDPSEIIHLLSLDSLGVMRDESPCPTPPGTPSVIGNVIAASLCQSDTLFGREWQAISAPTHPAFGIDIPRQWDGTNFDRVSQCGPGAGPTVTQTNVTVSTTTRSGNVTAVVLATPFTVAVGNLVNITGVGDVSYNGVYPVCSVTDSTHFSYYNAAVGFPISYLQRTGGTVTATVASLAFGSDVNPLAAGSDIVVVCPSSPSLNGRFTIGAVNAANNTFTYPQAGAALSGVSCLGYVLLPTATVLYSVTGVTIASDVVTATVSLGWPYSFNFMAYQPPLAIGLVVGSTIGPSGISNPSGDTVTAVSPGTYSFAGYSSPPDQTQGNNGYAALILTPNGNSTGGSIAIAGHISIGVHFCAVSFITRENYITKPSPPVPFFVSSSSGITLTNIPTGPPNIIGRIVMFTGVVTPPATSGPFFYLDGAVNLTDGSVLPSMVINDNTTMTYNIDFIDAVLENETSADNLFNLLELGECASMISYSNRTFWAGERNKLSNLLNLTFDGGFSSGVPLGWNADPANGAGGSSAVTDGYAPYWGDAYVITGDGASAIRGMISQSAFQDYLNVPIIAINTAYSARVRLTQNGVTQGAFIVELYSPSMGSIGLISISIIPSMGYREFILSLCSAQATIPSDLLLRIYANGTVNNGGYIIADCLEIFPTALPYNNNVIRASYAGDPESFDGSTGYMIVGPAQGQSVRAMFKLLDNKLYILTERGLYNTADDNQNEPSLWTINTVSGTVGTGAVHGVGIGESWAVIAAHDGAYIFWGGEPVKISQEIQPTWDTINWAYDQTIYVTVDTSAKRIVIGVPSGSSTTPNMEFVCDYSQLANSEGATAAQDIASHPQAYYSVYNPTKVVAPGKSRKWTIWNISANCSTLAVRSDGSYHLLRGNNIGNGKIYDQQPGQLNDDGVAINSMYQTAYTPQVEDEQALQLGSHRKLYKYLTGYACGAGTMNWFMYGAQNQRGIQLSSLTLQNPAHWDFEKNTNFVGERASYLFGTNNPAAWFQLTKLSPTLQRDIFTPVRGTA